MLKELQAALNQTADYIASGGVILVLGPDIAAGCTSVKNEPVPQLADLISNYKSLRKIGFSFTSNSDAIDYFTRNTAASNDYKDYVRAAFSVKSTKIYHSVL